MTDYAEMLEEYEKSKAALKRRISEIGEIFKNTIDTSERTNLAIRKRTLEWELEDMEDAAHRIRNYAECGVR